MIFTHNRHDFRMLHTAWLLWNNEWGVDQSHAGILIIEQMRWRAISDLARIIHDFVADRDVVLENTLFDWKPSTGWARYRS